MSSSQLIDGSFKYVAEFDPTLKKGSIFAFQLDTAGNFNTVKSWDAGELLRQLPSTSRQVITNNRATGVPFNWDTLPNAYRNLLKSGSSPAMSNAKAEGIVNYLRGDTDNEEPNGQRFQPRSISNLLGTVVNSTPWIQLPSNAYYFDAYFPATGVQSYLNYATSTYSRPKTLWVGANDGMLHGFNAGTGAPIISYVPGLLANRLNALTERNASIVAGVDGSPFTADVLRSAPAGQTATWATYLFSSLGRGGKGVFALDVSKVGDLTEANAANIFKWQFSDANDSDIGNIVGEYGRSQFSNQAIPVVRLNNNKFAVALPNGLNSSNGQSSIFLLTADGPPAGTTTWTLGTNYYKLTTTVADTSNGMTGMNWLDVDNNGTVDFMYGTDIKGNVWKFDLTSSNPNLWRSAFVSTTTGLPVPFYVAKDANNVNLPISTSPVFGFPRVGGVVVSFGTGSAIRSGDFPKEAVTQRMYGILDRTGIASGTTTVTLPTGTSTLVQRTTTVSTTESVKISSTPVVDYRNQDGWYFDFPGTSEWCSALHLTELGALVSPQLENSYPRLRLAHETPPARFYFLDP
ncbi:MAG: hypothetical protein HC771_24275, partial [Synechococcales cyanobacterium CRU_2_2]|nr:hypothetical protein [Synechococcales cyanobacterium CRU_2_2]